MDRDIWEEEISTKNVKWARHGIKTTTGLVLAAMNKLPVSKAPSFIYRHLLDTYMDVVLDGPLATDL